MIILPIPALFMTIIWILTPPPMLITSLNSGLKRGFLKINSSWVHLPMATVIKCLMSTVTILGINMKKLVRRGPLWNRRAVWHFMKFAQHNGIQFMIVEWNQDRFQLFLNRAHDLIWITYIFQNFEPFESLCFQRRRLGSIWWCEHPKNEMWVYKLPQSCRSDVLGFVNGWFHWWILWFGKISTHFTFSNLFNLMNFYIKPCWIYTLFTDF